MRSPRPSPRSPAPATRANRRLTCFVLLLVTLPAGLAWRFAPLPLSPFAYKYGGSALWAIGVYWLIATLLPQRPPAFLALLATAVAISVECFKRVRQPTLDVFRTTFAGKILLGRHFTVGAILAYGLAIATVAALDAAWRSRAQNPQH
jgi:hypothetical protein